MSGSVVERLRARVEDESVENASFGYSVQMRDDVRLLLAAVEAARDVVEDGRWVWDEGPRERLEEALDALFAEDKP